jgi:hypothetical protein
MAMWIGFNAHSSSSPTAASCCRGKLAAATATSLRPPPPLHHVRALPSRNDSHPCRVAKPTLWLLAVDGEVCAVRWGGW